MTQTERIMPKLLGIILDKYHNGSLAVSARMDWGDTVEDQRVSVNVCNDVFDSSKLPSDLFCAKDYSENEPLFRQLLDLEWIEKLDAHVPSGFVRLPVCMLTPKGKEAIIADNS